jgi:phosphatidylglycerol:prolipoprotein diacylglycerol transferase
MIRFTGVRTGVRGRPQDGDRFERIERVEGIVARSGRVTVTTQVRDINGGTWQVTASPSLQLHPGAVARDGFRPGPLPRRVLTATTRLAPLAHGPGVRLEAWPALVGLGVLVAIAVQGALLARAHLDVMAAIVISLVASVVGYLGAKSWYLVLHRQHPRTFLTSGTCIQGFLLGAIGTLAVGAAVTGLPVGTFVDAATPGLFFAMAIGRPGCFLSGCCAGRPTSSRWGLWSSDRRLAIRRYPVQLAEAAIAATIGAAALALVLATRPSVPGMVFVGAVAVYTFGRQLLFPLRADPRTLRGRALTMVICALVLAADLVVSAFA